MRRSSGSSAWRSADAGLDRRGAFDRIDHAAELDQGAIAHQLGDAAVVLGDLRFDEVLAQRLEARVRARLVGRHQPAVADDVRSQDRGEPARHQFGPIQNRKRMIGTKRPAKPAPCASAGSASGTDDVFMETEPEVEQRPRQAIPLLDRTALLNPTANS